MSIDIVPKATTVATATAISASVAAIAGATAVMAVTPQMLQPAAIREAIRIESPIRLPSHMVVASPVPMLPMTTGTHAEPRSTTSYSESFAPTQMIPVRRIAVVQNLMPGANAAGRRTNGLLLSARPDVDA